MNWGNTEVDYVKPICMFDISVIEQLKENFNWLNTQPLLKKVHKQKGIKYKFVVYGLKLLRSYQNLKLNEERPN